MMPTSDGDQQPDHRRGTEGAAPFSERLEPPSFDVGTYLGRNSGVWRVLLDTLISSRRRNEGLVVE